MAGIDESSVAVQCLIEEEIQRGIPAERIVVGGFSQVFTDYLLNVVVWPVIMFFFIVF